MANDDRNDLGEELPRNQNQSGQTTASRQVGGGPGASDMAAPGGSTGSGGYGNAQNQQSRERQDDPASQRGANDGSDRGERFDDDQGGGRDGETVARDDDLAADQAAHQDRGQRIAEVESDRD